MVTRLEKKKAIQELRKILNDYRDKGILFICTIDDVYEENENHILHDYQIIDVYRDEDQKGENKMKTLIIIDCVIACINLILLLEMISEVVTQVKKEITIITCNWISIDAVF